MMISRQTVSGALYFGTIYLIYSKFYIAGVIAMIAATLILRVKHKNEV